MAESDSATAPRSHHHAWSTLMAMLLKPHPSVFGQNVPEPNPNDHDQPTDAEQRPPSKEKPAAAERGE